MSHFRTVVSPGSSGHKMDISHRIMTVGSCFADAIGQRLHSNRLPTSANPFGILYNPRSIHKDIRYALFNEGPQAHSYLNRDGIFLNYDFHSELWGSSVEELSGKIRNTSAIAHYFLAQAEWLIITYGTAWVYDRQDTGETVANCHKMPQSMFYKALLSEHDIVASFGSLHAELKKFNSNLKIVLTVSPVRHLKDTLELNSVSKSLLRLACYSITKSFSDVEYFPAYEILMDDLRDYRFYKADMIHPTDVSEEYIWEKFGERYFSPALQDFLINWKEIQQAMNHKPFHPNSPNHQSFLKATLKKLDAIKHVIDVEKELETVRSQIA